MNTTILPERPSDVDHLLADLFEHMREARWLAQDIAGELHFRADALMLAFQQLERTLTLFISQLPAGRS